MCSSDLIGMNGTPLPIEHGFPARLVVPGLYGYVSATKWVTDIKLTTWAADTGYWIPRSWSRLGPIEMGSRIDVPRRASSVQAGPVVLGGVDAGNDDGAAYYLETWDGYPAARLRFIDTLARAANPVVLTEIGRAHV